MKASEIVNTLDAAVVITREGGQGSRRRVSEMLTALSTRLIRESAGFREHPALGLAGETLAQNEGDGWEACEWTQNAFYGGHAKFNDSEVIELKAEDYDIYGDDDSHLPLRVYDRKRKVVIGLIGPRIARALGRNIRPYSTAPSPLEALQAKAEQQRNAD